jgi:type I restriction enzyme R subunit
MVERRGSRKPLATVEIPEHYVRQGETRTVRPYQAEAMRALDHALELGKRRFLIELPTGTGKTDLICLYLTRLFQAGWAERVLVLVDREQLAKQALEAIQDVLSAHSSYWLRSGMARQEQQITVALLQTMIGRVDDYTAGYFDVVITDECHRSIYDGWKPALTRFDAIHVGLTATPANFIERNTYDFYQCEPGKPDFAYAIQDAFREQYLAPYRFASGITEMLAARPRRRARPPPSRSSGRTRHEPPHDEEFDRLRGRIKISRLAEPWPGKTSSAITSTTRRVSPSTGTSCTSSKGRYAESSPQTWPPDS